MLTIISFVVIFILVGAALLITLWLVGRNTDVTKDLNQWRTRALRYYQTLGVIKESAQRSADVDPVAQFVLGEIQKMEIACEKDSHLGL